MNQNQKYVQLNNNLDMPVLGFGVFASSPQETSEAVRTALNAGYRLIDTAAAYHNERQVGEGIKASGIKREELFITTKLWMTNYGFENALRAFDVSMRKLDLEYLDLYLLHWPSPSTFAETVQSYKAAEKLLADGRVKAIGVSNFSQTNLKNLLESTVVVPAVNQIELNPYFTQTDLRAAHKKLGIVTQAWSPIGGVYNRNPTAASDHPLENKVITDMAKKYEKSPAQVILRWHIQNGISAIPKSVKPSRIVENLDIFDFALSEKEMEAIEVLDTGVRAGANPETVGPTTFGLAIEEI